MAAIKTSSASAATCWPLRPRATDETRQTAKLLAGTLEPAVRLAILDALTDAAVDVTEVPSGVTEVHLHGRKPRIVSTQSKCRVTGYARG